MRRWRSGWPTGSTSSITARTSGKASALRRRRPGSPGSTWERRGEPGGWRERGIMTELDLEVRDVTVRFGGLVAVDSVAFEVAQGETVGVIGPNGAGKSTLLNAISGLVRLSGGTVHVVGQPVHGLRPDQRTRVGVGRTFQAAEVFKDCRVTGYARLGRLRHERASLIATALRLPSIVRAEREESRRAR